MPTVSSSPAWTPTTSRCRNASLAKVAHLRAQPACVAVGSRARFIDPDGAPIFDYVDHFGHAQIEAALLLPMIGILHPTVMMRRAAVFAAGGYTHEYRHVEDLDLFLRLAEVGELANLPEVLLEYRVHMRSVSHAHAAEQHKAGLRAVKAACARRGIRSVASATSTATACVPKRRASCI